MMKFLMVLIVSASVSQSFAASKHSNYYYHTKMKQMMMPSNINESTGTAIYRDPYSYEKITIQLSDLVAETDEPFNGINRMSKTVVKYAHHSYCQIYHIFENGMAYLDCFVSSYKDEFGRTIPGNIVRYHDHLNNHVGEVETVGEFSKNDRATLTKAYGDIEADSSVKIEALFPNGEALVKWKNVNIFNSKAMSITKKVKIEDLARN